MKKSSIKTCFFSENMFYILLKMKLISLLVFITLVSATASTFSQYTRFSIEFDNVEVKEVFQFIEKNSEFKILYNEKFIDIHRQVSIKVQDETIESVLDQILSGTNYVYKIYNKQVVIVSQEESNNSEFEKPRFSQPEKPVTGAGSIRGNITDERGFPMIGATIIVDKTTVGTIADANGNYQLLGVPAGRQVIKFSFVGYNTESREIELEKGDVIVLNVKMSMSQVELLEVVAYGQARGQQAAINQQLRAPGIVNVISAEKLQELPDVNVAEAIGRLPGLMVERNRGEGQKIIIRGLEPKYNAISIGGNMVPATALDDRSTDLNMISPDILGGVEVQKANTADMDASGLGGTVNLTLREAPSGLKINAGILSGYSEHSKSISNYRANVYLSNRFFKDKLGIMFTANADIAERNSDRFRVDYAVQGIPNYEEGEMYVKPWITKANMEVNLENRSRAGGSLLFDWKSGQTSTIKASNFIGYLDRNIYDRIKQLNLLENYINLYQYHDVVTQFLNSHSIEGKHFIFGSVMDWGSSYSRSVNEKPYGHRVQFRKLSAFNGYSVGKSFDIEPPEYIGNPEYINDILEQYYFYNGEYSTFNAKESESSMFLNWKTPFRLGNFTSGYVKAGTKFRVKNRIKLNYLEGDRMDSNTDVNAFLQVYPEYTLTTEGNIGRLSIMNFLDKNYTGGDFLYNQYDYLRVNEVLERNLIAELYDGFLREHYIVIPGALQDDYTTHEAIFSYYLMTEFKFGKYVTFIPGVRCEQTNIEYGAYIAEDIPDTEEQANSYYRDTIATNSYQHILPQIHLKIAPADWFDIRLAYTNTLSRPDYYQLAPKKIINITNRTIKLGNTKLNPVYSENFDLILTLYKQKFGLLTLGAFYKEIEGFLWTRQAMIVAGTGTDPSILDVPLTTLGYTASYPLNNKNISIIKGFEVDLQSNINFLPVKGFVFNMNLTLMDSRTKYSETLIVRTANPDFGVVPGAPRVIFVNQDTAYADRLLKQPSYLANIGLGYDNRKIGLSVRLSFNYQDDILIKEQKRPDGADREGTLQFYRWDFQVNQKITKKLSFNSNIANIFNQPDRSARLITGYISNLEYYGSLAQIGLKYDFF